MMMASFLLFLSLQLVLVASSSLYSIASTRVAFYPRGSHVGASSSSSSTLLARRKISPRTRSSVQTAGLRRKRAPAPTLDLDDEFDPSPPTPEEPTLEELRRQLGPISKCVANSIELAVTSAGSFFTGGILGYVGGSVMGLPSTMFGQGMGGLGARGSALHAKAMTSCLSWATLSASFHCGQNAVRLCRGGLEDEWNAVVGSALAGAFLNRGKGPAAMVQGGATYAGFTYFADRFFGSSSSQEDPRSAGLMYTDVPLDDCDLPSAV